MDNKTRLPAEGTRIRYDKHEWDVLRKIADGIFSQVFVLEDTKDRKKKYAMKIEMQQGCARPVLKLDVHLLRILQGRPGFPEFIAAGRTSQYKFCVMKFIGPELGALQRLMPGNRFSPSTAYNVVLQTFDRLQTLHELGWLNRDVKANNFAVGLGPEANTVFMLDFGLARRYLNSNGSRRRRRVGGPCVGTIPFAPLSSNCLEDQSPRDDLEGWFYMCAYLILGRLPWFGCSREPLTLAHAREWKKFLRGSYRRVFFDTLPRGWMAIFESIVNTGYSDTPDYVGIRQKIYGIVKELGLNLSEPFDWMVVPRLVEEMKYAQSLTSSRQSAHRPPAESPKMESPEEVVRNSPPSIREPWRSSHYAWKEDNDPIGIAVQ